MGEAYFCGSMKGGGGDTRGGGAFAVDILVTTVHGTQFPKVIPALLLSSISIKMYPSSVLSSPIFFPFQEPFLSP